MKGNYFTPWEQFSCYELRDCVEATKDNSRTSLTGNLMQIHKHLLCLFYSFIIIMFDKNVFIYSSTALIFSVLSANSSDLLSEMTRLYGTHFLLWNLVLYWELILM